MLTITFPFSAYAKSTHSLFANETEITFQANSGEKTDAVEGFLFVPENRNKPDSRQIRVNYVRFPLFQALREFADVIALEQRGTGASEQAEECVSDDVMLHSKLLNPETVAQQYKNAALTCLANWQQQGFDVEGYTTVQNALDIDDLRQHLKAEKVSLWGISYGSHLALDAIRLFPLDIEKVIIASAEGLDQTVKLPAQTDQYFQQVQKVIDQQALQARVSDLPGLIRRVHSKLDDSPIKIDLGNANGKSNIILLQKQHMQMLTSRMIADPSQYLAILIQVYVELDSGQTQTLSNILSRGMFSDGPIRFRLMSLAMDVASGISPQRLAKVKQQAKTSLLGEYLNFPMPVLNNVYPKLDLGNDFRSTLRSDIPTLLLTGTLDGRTYPDEQADAVMGFTNIRQVHVQYAGHNLYMSSPEILVRMKQFLRGDKVSTSPIELPLPQLSLN